MSSAAGDTRLKADRHVAVAFVTCIPWGLGQKHEGGYGGIVCWGAIAAINPSSRAHHYRGRPAAGGLEDVHRRSAAFTGDG